MDNSPKLNLTLYLLFLLLSFNNAREFITPNQPLKDNNDSIVSHGGQFELGFFNIGTGRYLGIRYYNFAKGVIIWVGNRNTPLNDTSGVLTLTQKGTLLLSTTSDTSITRNIWSTNVSRPSDAKNQIARLLDTGNLVVVGSSNSGNNPVEDNYLWESFDHPGNTLMPTMKIGMDLETGFTRYMTSWVTEDDPSIGQHKFFLDPSGYPQLFVTNKNQITFRIGPWNGERFSGGANLKPNNQVYTYKFVNNETDIYYESNLVNNVPARLVLDTNGVIQRWIWVEKQDEWVLYLTGQVDKCDTFNLCGPFGSCMISNSPPCGCFDGFEAKEPGSWNSGYWSDGCVRSVELECGKDGFKRVSGLKLPDTRNVVYSSRLSLKECERLCHQNCSCVGFANLDVRNGGSGCLMWFDQLIDIRVFGSNGGQDVYLRMNASQLGYNGSNGRKLLSILVPTLSIGALSLILWLILHTRKQKKLKEEGKWFPSEDKDLELPLFDFAEINKATHYFSSENKLGQGGFGIVYKGILNDGQEIAVKRLSKHSKQGIMEFKNEVSCIAKLQHRNLVKLLGCCIQGEERILIYEYMPNKSLDLIFDQTKSDKLDWAKRFDIINGIARGLSYLHQDSRLRIIHRDLKASNVLLDHNLKPKISDFGMARIFGGEETDQENTNRVVGTYGYMAPEYAIDGIFSMKSDIFSFGVLVLEIVSGKKNRGFSHPGHELNLLGHAWRLHKEGKSLELLDFSMKESAILPQVMRAIHIGLLCVQRSPEVRPSMSMVNLMLGSTILLSVPKEPGFFSERNFDDPSSSSSMLTTSPNEISVSVVEAR